MSPDQERRLEAIFRAARGLTPRERTAFLERACRGDAELRRQSGSLLAAHERAVLSRNCLEGLPDRRTENPMTRRFKLLYGKPKTLTDRYDI
jgi:hypothetical protein